MIININNPPLHAVAISRQGENEFRAIEIDVSAWLAEYPDGKISVIYCRPDGELYPVIVNAAESPIIWRPTATDTAAAGKGAIEVRIQIGDVLGKSCTIEANVLGALGAPGDTPAAPAPDWAQQVAEDAESAAAAAEKAEAASTHMPQIGASKTWLVWDANKGEYVDTGVSAAGEKGDDGDPGKAPIIGSNGNWYEWDDASGAYTDTGKPSRGEKGNTGAEGADGADGRDGITPTIGENGNWYLGDTDTGKPSRGETGPAGADGRDGADGQPGADGKSAYAYAVEGGYTGTEEEFAAKMAAWSGLTTAQINALDGMFKVCAFTKDNVSAEYTAFKTAFGIADSGGETEVTLTSISAVYGGGEVAVGTAVTDLTGIVVTAHYSDGTSATVTGYTLSGTIAEGENTITVIYQGKSATFTVNGIAESTGENNGWTNGVAYDIEWADGYSLDGTGTAVEDKDLSVSDFLPCQNVSRMVTSNLHTNYRLWYYDADKNYLRLSPLSYVVNLTNIETYRDAYYVRTCKRIATTNASIVPYRDDLLDADTAWEANKYYRLNWIDNHSELALCYGASALQFSNASRSFITWYDADKNEIETVIRQNVTTAVIVPNDAFYFSIENDNSGVNFWVQLS